MKMKSIFMACLLFSANAYSTVSVRCQVGLPGTDGYQDWTTFFYSIGNAQLQADYCQYIAHGVATIRVIDDGPGGGNGSGPSGGGGVAIHPGLDPDE